MKVVSFFSGLGGLDKGFVDNGYDIIWANDFDKYAVIIHFPSGSETKMSRNKPMWVSDDKAKN